MEPLSLIVAIGIICFLLLYFAFSLNEDANRDKGFAILKLILILFAVFMMVLIPKTTLDYKDNCDFVVTNQSEVANHTYFSYNYTCQTNAYDTPISFYKYVINFIRVFGIFIAVWFTYYVLKYFGVIKYFSILNRR